jgi:hypothetical protein
MSSSKNSVVSVSLLSALQLRCEQTIFPFAATLSIEVILELKSLEEEGYEQITGL